MHASFSRSPFHYGGQPAFVHTQELALICRLHHPFSNLIVVALHGSHPDTDRPFSSEFVTVVHMIWWRSLHPFHHDFNKVISSLVRTIATSAA
jgi:hypothetical protein